MLAIVESPYQLQNTLSLLKHLSVEKEHTIVFIRDNGNQEQMEQFLKMLDSEKAIYFYLPISGLSKIPRLVYFYFKYIKSFFTQKKFIFGDARSLVCRPMFKLSKYFGKEIYLVDDGLYLISYIDRLKNFPCFLYTSLPIKANDRDKFKVVLQEDEKFDTYQSNSSVSFIGQHLVELNFIGIDNYLKVLANVKALFEVDHKNFIYYAHRNESNDKLSKVKRLGFQVLRLDCNIEQYFRKNSASKGIFISYYSTALYNIFKSHESSVFYCCDDFLDFQKMKSSDSVKLCYEMFNRAGIEKLTFV